MSAAQWERVDRECSYEAEKATASADPRTAVSFTWTNLFIMCAELKGATYVGTVRMDEERYKGIRDACRTEVARASLKGSTPHARAEEMEDLQIACMRRNGIRFEREAWL